MSIRSANACPPRNRSSGPAPRLLLPRRGRLPPPLRRQVRPPRLRLLPLATYRLFQQTAMSDEEFGAYFDRVYYGPDKVNVEKEMEPKNKKKDNREKLRELFEAGTGMDIEGVRGTVWAGYNAVTEFATSERTPKRMTLCLP